jgi:hypothetical protein
VRTIRFIIERLEHIGSNKFLAGGRNCLAELRKGDRLQVAVTGSKDSIEVIVNEMTMYAQEMTEVPNGLTAGLIFDNEVSHHFRLGTKLKAEIT